MENHPPDTRSPHQTITSSKHGLPSVPAIAVGKGVVARIRPAHHANDHGQDELIETATIGRKGAGTPDASAVFAILDAAPAIRTGTKGAGQHFQLIDKKLVFLLEPPECGPAWTARIGERSTARGPSGHCRHQILLYLAVRRILRTPRPAAQQLKRGNHVVEIRHGVARHVLFPIVAFAWEVVPGDR